jgi:uncharacterized protein YycO
MAHTSKSYGPGEIASEYQVGDFILCHRKGFASWCIRFGQDHSPRFAGHREYGYWSHAALIVSEEGDLVEALTKGVVRSHISDYQDVEYTLVRVHAAPLDQEEILRFANKVVGDEYGWTTIVCVGLGLMTGGDLTFGFEGHMICSGLVALAEERAGAVFDRLAEDIVPADLARYYDVKVPVHT